MNHYQDTVEESLKWTWKIKPPTNMTTCTCSQDGFNGSVDSYQCPQHDWSKEIHI